MKRHWPHLGLALALLLSAGLSHGQVSRSSHTTTNDTAAVLFTGPGLLESVHISSAGAGSTLQVWNARDASAPSAFKIDTDAEGDYTFNIYTSTGFSYTAAGTEAAKFTFKYKQRARGSTKSSHTATADTTENLFTGRGWLRGVVASGGAAGSSLRLFDSQDGLSNPIFEFDGLSEFDEKFDLFISTGLTYTTTGTEDWTIIYEEGY